MVKLCTECGIEPRRGPKAGNCAKCHAKRQREWYALNRDRQRDAQLKAHYGIDLAEYNRLYDEQDGRCLICGEEETLGVDHDHATGAVRGLLCSRCNVGVGYFRDDVALLLKAVDYLTRVRANT